MSQTFLNPNPITVRRAVGWTIVLFPAVLLALISGFWIWNDVPTRVYWKAGLLLLIALEIAYAVSVSLAALGALFFGVLVVRTRRSGRSLPWPPRGLQLCGSVLLAAILIEAACAARRNREQGASPPFADVSLPTEFDDPPGDRDIDLVVLGESSAEGVPFNEWLSIANILAWKLTEAIPGRTIRQNVLALSGDTLKGQHKRLGILTRRPEILVVYSGNSEFTMGMPESLDSAYYVDERLPAVMDVFVNRIERSSPACGLLHELQQKCRPAIREFKLHDRNLIDEPIYTQDEYTTLLGDFRRRLETIVSYAEGLGAMPILIAPAGNDAGFEPNRSFLPANTPRAERESFARDFVQAKRTESTDPDQAMGLFRALLAKQPGFAEAHYRLAKLLEHEGQWEEAYRHYVAARDHDGHPVRLPNDFQHIYRDVAARHDCILIDMQSYFHLIGVHGLLNDELFQDAMHLSLRGHIALSQAVLHALYARRAVGWPKDSAVPFIDPSECAEHFNLKSAAWKSVCFSGVRFEHRASRWRYDQAAHLERQALYAQAIDRIKAGAAPESLGLANIGVPAPVPVELSARATECPLPRSGLGEPIRFESNLHR